MMEKKGDDYMLTTGEAVVLASIILFGVGWMLGMFAAKVANAL